MLSRLTPARSALLLGSALGVSLAVFAATAPTRALANDECGAITPGTPDKAVCTAVGNDYNGGITYDDNVGGTPNDLTVVLTGGGPLTAVNVDTAGDGVRVFGASGYSATLVAYSGAVVSAGGAGMSVYAYNGQAVISNSAAVYAGGSALNAFGNGGDARVYNDAALTSYGTSGGLNSGGILAFSNGGDAYVENSGQITATGSSTFIVGGIGAISTSGIATVENFADISAKNYVGFGVGVVEAGANGTGLFSDSNIYAYGYQGAAGVLMLSGGGAGVFQYGDTTAVAYAGDATGVGVLAAGPVYAELANVTAVSTYGDATAIDITSGDAVSLTMYGDATAVATENGRATGISISAAGPVNAGVTGNVSAVSSYGYAVGAMINSGDTAVLGVTGDVTAVAGTSGGPAIGISVSGATGVSIGVSGDLTAVSGASYATGVQAFSGGDVSIGVGGNVTAVGDTYATGVRSGNFGTPVGGTTQIGVDGAINATGGTRAYGVLAYGDGDISIDVTGPIMATATGGANSYAWGVYAMGAAGGNITIDVGDVTVVQASGPSGGGDGITSYTTGTTKIYANNVITIGDFADGVTVGGPLGIAGDTLVSVNSVTTNGYASIGIRAEGHGDFKLYANQITTYGDYSDGVSAYSDLGNVTVGVGGVTTYGWRAAAISAHSGAGSVGVANYGTVVTWGDESDGIQATSADAGVTVTGSGSIFTHGAYSDGIRVYAQTGVSVGNDAMIMTEGYAARGVSVSSYDGPVGVSVNAVVTYGAYADAIHAYSYNGKVTVAVADVAYSEQADAIYAGSYNNTVTVNIGAGAYVAGGHDGVRTYSFTGTTVNNAGVVKSLGGAFAIDADGFGAATINNLGSGVIIGRIALTGQNDVVNNAGRFDALGSSFFGSGTDVFNNSGMLRVAPTQTTATTVHFLGLETFSNTGTVTLSQGHTGDVLNLHSAAFAGSGPSKLVVDADLSSALATDKLVIGAASGSTKVQLVDSNPGDFAALNFTGVTVVDATSGPAGAFALSPSPTRKDWVAYDLVFDGAGSNWNLVGLPGKEAFEMVKAGQAGQNFWRRSADAWGSRQSELRDSMGGDHGRPDGTEMWAQVYGGSEKADSQRTFEVAGFSFAENLSMKDDWFGFEGGVDGVKRTATGYRYWGVTAGYLEQTSKFRADHNAFELKGWNLGAYGGWNWGGFFADGLLKADFYEVDTEMRSLPLAQTHDGSTWGAQGELGYRFGGRGLFLEPVADLAWTRTSLDQASGLGAVVDYDDATSFRGRIGARIGGDWSHGATNVSPYLGVFAVDEFKGDNAMTFRTGATGFSISDDAVGTYGKVDFGLTARTFRGVEGFVKGEAAFGDVSGWTGRMGVRWRW